ncbi:MAG: DNA helicase II [Gammaproteobacteria bacterium]|nr:MAG: DNA helicase II [Gammaproteobacteria bacterium]
MAEIIPPLNQQTLSRMWPGERRLAQRLKELLEDDYLVWYDIPIGRQRRYPDFIILHPARGLLFLEVKDWKIDNIRQITKSDVTLLTDAGLVTKPHPLEQVRGCAYAVIDRLARDPQLQAQSGRYRGRLIMPWGWGVVFPNITRKQMQHAIPDDARENVLPDHLVIYQDEMTAGTDAEAFQERLWNMFNYQFGDKLTLPQIDRIRWHLFPEIRIDQGIKDLFNGEDEASDVVEQTLPDIVKVMDIQQEQLARSLGEGHRVIHGVAGSGKTMILGYRCLYLAEAIAKPILVLCFNIALAARLRSFISARGIGTKVQIYHFHDWCAQQLKTYHVDLLESDAPVWERQVETVIQAVEQGHIPRAQYGAVLIDEGHDFEAEWLKLVTQMIDPETNSLLLLYDDAQSIYKKRSGLGFSLSSVGIQAKGRTTVLRLNYRNTREILRYAYDFARHYLDPKAADEDHIPLVEPEAAGTSGPVPVLRQFESSEEELRYAAACIRKWQGQGIALREIGILYPGGDYGRRMANVLHASGIDRLWLGSRQHKAAYDPEAERVTVLTIHSSKGLEFRRVILIGLGMLGNEDDRVAEDARLLYVGMTRAQEGLLLTSSGEGRFGQLLSSGHA